MTTNTPMLVAERKEIGVTALHSGACKHALRSPDHKSDYDQQKTAQKFTTRFGRCV